MTDDEKLSKSLDRIEQNVSILGNIRFQLTAINAIILAVNFIILIINLMLAYNISSQNDLQNVRLDIMERKIEVRQFIQEQEK